MKEWNDMRRRLVPDIINLQAFECAARHQNFSRAAQELNLTQGAISRQIAELEQQTGLQLFERVRQRVILSESGLRFLPEVRELLLQSERLMIGAVTTGKMKNSLRIATLPTFGSSWLVPRLGDFQKRHANIALTIESRSKPFSFDEDPFDLAIHYGQPVWAGGVATFLCRETVQPIANPAVAKSISAQTPPDLIKAPLLHLTTRPELWAEWYSRHDKLTNDAYVGLRMDQFSMLISASIAGLGIALLPTYLVEKELKSGALVTVFDQTMTTDNAYYVVRPEQSRTNLASNTFESWLLSSVSNR